MTTQTNDGEEWMGDRMISDSPSPIDEIAVGTGKNESEDATSLGNEIYDAPTSNDNVELVETGDTGEFEAIIVIKGGTQVPANSDITEVGVYAGGILVAIDEFNAVTVKDGRTEEFTIPVNPRGA